MRQQISTLTSDRDFELNPKPLNLNTLERDFQGYHGDVAFLASADSSAGSRWERRDPPESSSSQYWGLGFRVMFISLWTLILTFYEDENWLFSKLWAPVGSELYYGTSYLGVPKWDPNFGNYPINIDIKTGHG